MRQKTGFVLQAMVLMFTPLLIGWDLWFHPHFLFVLTGLTSAVALFSLGYFLRQP
jgi:hypothetical protein